MRFINSASDARLGAQRIPGMAQVGCTAGVHTPVGRRMVSPIRTTVVSPPEACSPSSITTDDDSRSYSRGVPQRPRIAAVPTIIKPRCSHSSRLVSPTLRSPNGWP
jgi:hypothetical protein